MSLDLGLCTMPGCMEAAQWVHGNTLVDQEGKESYPWHLCQECHESVRAADLALHDAGIPYPDDAMWVFEAARTWLAQMKKMEGLKP